MSADEKQKWHAFWRECIGWSLAIFALLAPMVLSVVYNLAKGTCP